MKTFTSSITSLLILFLITSSLWSQTKEEIFQAIKQGAAFSSNVILDDSGKSRCDYNMITGRWEEYEPAWHTGQQIFGLVEAFKVLGDSSLLNRASEAGDWWKTLEFTDHPQLTGMLNAKHAGPHGDLINFTTVTDGTNGIFELYRLTKDEELLQVSIRVADWMLKNMYIEKEALFYNIVDPATGEVWTDKSPHHDVEKASLKQVARPNNEGYFFLDLYKETGVERYKKVFLNLCDGLVKRQGEEGLWMDFEPNDPESGKIHPRFNLWYAESLLEGYELTGNKEYLDAALKTARFYTRLQKPDGTIYYHNYLDGKYRRDSLCGSAVSFAGILWLRLERLGYSEFAENIQKSLNWVLDNRFSPDHPDMNLAGGFLETRTVRYDDVYAIMMRDIATSFGLRFLSMYVIAE